MSRMGWLHHVVHELLCSTGEVGAAHAARARGHAGVHRKAQGRPYQSRCFAGAEGYGCELSVEELRIAARVSHKPMSWEV